MPRCDFTQKEDEPLQELENVSIYNSSVVPFNLCSSARNSPAHEQGICMT